MSQHYSDPSRENEPNALPDVEIFYFSPEEAASANQFPSIVVDGPDLEPGYYYWSCFPGCLPDSDPMGPYTTEQEAIDAAQEDSE